MAVDASNVMREFNRARVLGAVRDGTASSRGELCAVTALSRTTVTALVLELIDAGALVEVTQSTTDHPGRPTRRLQLAPRSDLVVAVDFGHSHCRVGIVDARGAVLVERNDSFDVDASADRALDHARRVIAALIEQVDRTRISAGAVRRARAG